ncbi:hypothetical protein QWZ10_10360 [Paracoccus cavernae]|uniref:Uncharacterized protein n=1 Tax=Paracoccus cavernae TaxID=1571207 RepID=A0ABT8D6E6_9RHOB|nr:hypothetical protein [Paracoccus cavernae]
MMAPDDFRQGVVESGEEVFVGADDLAGGFELDHRLRARHGLLTRFGLFQQSAFAHGHIRRVFHHAQHIAAFVDNWVVAGNDPDIATALGKAVEFTGMKIAVFKVRPELAIFHAVGIGRFAENAVVAAFDFGGGIAEGFQEILVGRNDFAIGLHLDHGLRARNGILEREMFLGAQVHFRLVQRENDDLLELAVGAHDRHMGFVNPIIVAVFGDMYGLGLLRGSTAERRHEVDGRDPVGILILVEHHQRLADQLFAAIAANIEIALVHIGDPAIEIVNQNGLNLFNRGQGLTWVGVGNRHRQLLSGFPQG